MDGWVLRRGMAKDSEFEYDPERHNHIVRQVVRNRAPAAQWDEEDMKEALLKKGRKKLSINAAAEDYEFSHSTLGNLWKDVKGRIEEYEASHEPEPETAPESAFEDPAAQVANEVQEFFKPICESSDLKEGVIEFLVVDDIRESGDIPTAVQLMQIILSGTTGVSNQRIAGRICQKYQRFIEGNDPIQKFLSQGEITLGQASWAPGGTMGGGMGMAPGVGPQPHPGQHPNGQQPQPQQPEEQTDPIDELIELQKKKEKLQQALGVGGTNEHLMQLQQQMQELQVQIQEGGAGQGEVGYEGFPENAPPSAQVAWLVKETDMDHEDAKEFVTENKSPEVMDYELERQKFERRATLMDNAVDRIADTISEVFGDWDRRLGDSLYENIKEDATEEESPSRAQQQERATGTTAQSTETADAAVAETASVEQEECDSCGGTMLVSGPMRQCQSPGCRKGTVQCDLCQQEGSLNYIDLPPVGECDTILCGGEGCHNVLSRPTDADTTVTCGECGWEGTAEESPYEVVTCEACDRPRPVGRTEEELEAIREEGLHMLGVAA